MLVRRVNQGQWTLTPVGLRLWIGRIFALVLILGSLVFSSIVPVLAQSAKCTRLEHQLASLSAGKRSVKNDTGAIRAQRSRIGKLKQAIKIRGCAAKKKLFKRDAHASCSGLRSDLRLTQRKLKRLEKQKSHSVSGKGSTTAETNRIKRALRRNRCGQDDTKTAVKKRSGFFRSLFGASKRVDRKNRGPSNVDLMDQMYGSRSNLANRQAVLDRHGKGRNRKLWSTRRRLKNFNTVRTICVRRCDGYYFPVSFSTNESGIERDSTACANLCPGREMELFTHKTSTETVDDMTSVVDGQFYTSMETAYAYRQSFNPQCACDFKKLDQRYSIDRPAEEQSIASLDGDYSYLQMAVPEFRPSWPTADDEGGETVEITRVRPPATILRTSPKQPASTERKIRVIGDAFFPNQ